MAYTNCNIKWDILTAPVSAEATAEVATEKSEAECYSDYAECDSAFPNDENYGYYSVNCQDELMNCGGYVLFVQVSTEATTEVATETSAN